MDHRFSHSYIRAVRRLNRSVRCYQQDFLTNCRIVLCLTSFTELCALEYTTNYLDLALTPPSHMTLKRQVRTLVHRSMSFWYREFFLAETVPQHHVVASMYDPASYLGLSRTSTEVMERMLILFEDLNFLEISRRDFEEKKRNLRKYLRAYRVLPIDHFDRRFSDLLNLCVNPPLDCELTVDLLTTFCDTDKKKLSVFHLLPAANSLENLILHAKNMRFDFWGLWSGNSTLPSYYYSLPYSDVLNLSHEQSKILLKYGFPYTTDFAAYLNRCLQLDEIKFENRNIIRFISIFLEHTISEKRIRMMLIMDTFLTFETWTDVEDKVKTLKYLNRSLPLPYVTPMELYDTMLQAVKPEFIPQLQLIVFKYSKADIFDDDFEISMPKPLMHLCRVAVRKILAHNFLLVEQLSIPESLKPYLELEC